MTDRDYLSVAESRRLNYLIPEYDKFTLAEQIEFCKLEALLSIAADVREIKEKGLVMEEPQH